MLTRIQVLTDLLLSEAVRVQNRQRACSIPTLMAADGSTICRLPRLRAAPRSATPGFRQTTQHLRVVDFLRSQGRQERRWSLRLVIHGLFAISRTPPGEEFL